MLRVNLNIQTQKQDTVAQTIEYIVSSWCKLSSDKLAFTTWKKNIALQ
jgi:hypothetical protein